MLVNWVRRDLGVAVVGRGGGISTSAACQHGAAHAGEHGEDDGRDDAARQARDQSEVATLRAAVVAIGAGGTRARRIVAELNAFVQVDAFVFVVSRGAVVARVVGV